MADFYAPGAVDIWFGDRGGNRSQISLPASSSWRYLGTAVEAPEILADVIETPIMSDNNAPAPFQIAFNSEAHQVIVTANRLNFGNYNFLKSSNEGDANIVRKYSPGYLKINEKDFCLYLKNSNVGPANAATGRIYYSAILKSFHETNVNSRVEEVSFLFECNPLFVNATKVFWLYTENATDFPTLPLE